MNQASDRIGVLQRARASLDKARAARLAIVVLIAMVALAASPEVSGATATPIERGVAAPAEQADVVVTPADVVATPAEEPAAEEPAAEEPAVPVESSGAVDVSGAVHVKNALVIVNRDGSATVSADLTNGTDTEVALMDVRVEKGGQALPVSATPMWLSVPPGVPARVGDASDAGGFVVPQGVVAGTALTLRFRFDSGACLTKKTEPVARSREHSFVYPKSGNRLGPATQPATVGFENC